MSIGGGESSTTNPNNAQSTSSGGSSESSSSNSSSFRDPSFIWGGQSPYLQGLYQQGQNTFNNTTQGSRWRKNAEGVYDKAMQGFNQMMNPGVNPQLQAYSGEVQRNLERNLLPSIGSEAQGFGQMGGSRQGVAEGLALSDSNQQITDMASNLYNADMNRMGAAMSMAPSLGTFGQQIPWYNMNQYSGILGDPTQMQGAAGSDSSSSSSGSSFSESQSTDTGGGTGDQGWNFNVGFPTG